MYYVELENLGFHYPDPNCLNYPRPGYGLRNSYPFQNIMTGPVWDYYWTSIEMHRDSTADGAFTFRFNYGDQACCSSKTMYPAYVWPVCDMEPAHPLSVFEDHFEDGIVDPNFWTVGGSSRTTYGGPGGPWQYSNDEVFAPDGYLRCQVLGPQSGNTYGAEAWVRTNYNFNDGKNYLINFTWEPVIFDNYYNAYSIQITDGNLDPNGNPLWLLYYDDPGTANFLHNGSTAVVYLSYNWPDPGYGKENWSIVIDSAGSATLYDSRDAAGAIIRQVTLDHGYPWHVRFVVHDATSAGFQAVGAELRLYDFQATDTSTSFSSFINEKTKVEYKLGSNGEKVDKLENKWWITLGEDSNGIYPLIEDVEFTVGNLNFSIPAGSFQLDSDFTVMDTCTLFADLYTTGTCDEGKNYIKIKKENGFYKFNVKLEKCNLPEVGTVNPLNIKLTIGDDRGELDLFLSEAENTNKVEFKGNKP